MLSVKDLSEIVECLREEFRSDRAFTAVLATLGKSDILRTHEVPNKEF